MNHPKSMFQLSGVHYKLASHWPRLPQRSDLHCLLRTSACSRLGGGLGAGWWPKGFTVSRFSGVRLQGLDSRNWENAGEVGSVRRAPH